MSGADPCLVYPSYSSHYDWNFQGSGSQIPTNACNLEETLASIRETLKERKDDFSYQLQTVYQGRISPKSSQDWKTRLKIPSPDTRYRTELLLRSSWIFSVLRLPQFLPSGDQIECNTA